MSRSQGERRGGKIEEGPVSEWTLEQAAELYCEAILLGIEGADDDDVIRPRLVVEELARLSGVDPDGLDLPEVTVAEVRRRMQAGRAQLGEEDADDVGR
jgi:hypothetical protein